jgi:ABC-type branched-subunit amino acid transport system substrate-binding protein
MNNNILALAVITVGMLSGTGLASAEIPSEVKVGGIFDKNWAEGDESSRVAEIAVDDFNAYLENIGADWEFSISIEDAQSLSSIALDKIQAFKGSGVDLLVGVAFSSHINLAASYIDDNDMLVLSHASQAANLAIDDSVFRLVPNDGNQAPAIVKMLEDAGIEVLVTAVRGDTWGDGLVAGVKEHFTGTIEPGFRYNPDVSEFSVVISVLDETIARLIEEHGADKVGVFYVGTDEFLPMMQAMRYYTNVHDVRWFSTNTQSVKTYFFEDPDAIEFAKATQFTATRSIPTDGNNIKDHIDAQYMEMYNATVSTYGYAAYDSIWLLGTAILQTQSTDTNTLTAAIPHVASHMLGASGDLTLTEYGDLATANFEVWQVGDGAWVRVNTD